MKQSKPTTSQSKTPTSQSNPQSTPATNAGAMVTVPPPTTPKVTVEFSLDGTVQDVHIQSQGFHELTTEQKGIILMKVRNNVEKEYLKMVKQYSQETSLGHTRALFGSVDQMKAM